jgi:hypothetical protein
VPGSRDGSRDEEFQSVYAGLVASYVIIRRNNEATSSPCSGANAFEEVAALSLAIVKVY